jgi:hypothetical protein
MNKGGWQISATLVSTVGRISASVLHSAPSVITVPCSAGSRASRGSTESNPLLERENARSPYAVVGLPAPRSPEWDDPE